MAQTRFARGVVVVLSWHGRADTLRLVEALAPREATSDILVVDNGSYDGVLDEASARWPEVHTLQTGANLGFAGGMNRGIAWALERGATFVTVLNNDTVVGPGAIAALEAAAAQGAVVSPEIYRIDDPSVLWFGGASIDERDKVPGHVAAGALGVASHGLRPSPVLAGCCLTASRDTWQSVGLFDERYFLNFEDSDWSVRAAAAGHDLVVDTRVRILHAVSASFTGAARLLSTYYFVRNGLLFNRVVGGSLVSRVHFVRQRALHTIAAERRGGRHREARREALMVAWAIASYATGRFGPAPAALQRRVDRWRPRDTAPPGGTIGPSLR
ncbi:MAG: glycosyltransferase family 2 protein [Demequina sp.]